MKLSYTPVVVTLAFSLLLSLSAWQLYRGLNKQSLLKSQTIQNQKPILEMTHLEAMLSNPVSYSNRIIRLRGYFQNNQTILLDNKIHEKQVGYQVITPFLLDTHQIILVNRGWIPIGSSRTKLPQIEPILNRPTPFNIKGTLNIPVHNRFIKNTLESQTFPLRIQEVKLNLLQPLFPAPLLPFVMNLSEDSPFSFEAIPETKQWLSPEKHFAYALQWLLLAFSLIIIYTRVLNKKS